MSLDRNYWQVRNLLFVSSMLFYLNILETEKILQILQQEEIVDVSGRSFSAKEVKRIKRTAVRFIGDAWISARDTIAFTARDCSASKDRPSRDSPAVVFFATRLAVHLDPRSASTMQLLDRFVPPRYKRKAVADWDTPWNRCQPVRETSISFVRLPSW